MLRVSYHELLRDRSIKWKKNWKWNSFLHYYLVGNNYLNDEKKDIKHEINIVESGDNKYIRVVGTDKKEK